MNRIAYGLLACLSLAWPITARAEVTAVGSHRVTRYSVTDDTADGKPLAIGEIAEGSAGGVHLELADTQRELSLSRAEARSIHQLLGHMLAMSAPDPAPQPPAHTDPPSDTPSTTDTPTASPPPGPAVGAEDGVPQPSANRPAGTTAVDTRPATKQTPGKKPFLGMNLADVTYYSRAWVFTDLMLQSDAWRKDGSAHVFMSGYAPPGRYVCTWSGTGSIRFSGNASAQKTGPNSARVTITAGERGINMRRVGEVQDASLMRIEHETRTSPFQPEFLRRLEPFKVIRFMDWANTNNSTQTRWGDRPQKGGQTQAGGDGVAIEYMIALANELGADPWFCMPHMADDDYIRRYAQLVRDRLHPDAKVYIEYSNEVWNTQFKQHNYIRRLGGNTDTFSDEFFDAWARRCRRTFAIWSEVFGDDAPSRLVRVAAVHLQNPWVAQKLLPRLQGEFDAVAPSAYFGITRKQAKKLTVASTADDVLDLCQRNIKQDNRDWYERHARLARDWSAKLGRPIRLISYEAGQHLSANGDDNLPYFDALIRAQSHPRMYGLYLLNMRTFEQAGGDLFTAFNDVGKPGKFGSWGHLVYQLQPTGDAPKFKALLDYPSIREP
jgi:hypothetical protein